MIFTTARPHNARLCGMELLAQVRPNGRILDHYRVSLCKRQPYPIDVNCRLAELLLCPTTAELRFKYSVWPRDVDIKKNMSTSAWSDVYDLLASKRASVTDEENQLIPSDRLLQEIKEAGNMAACALPWWPGRTPRCSFCCSVSLAQPTLSWGGLSSEGKISFLF